ncbi:hypothetical protein Tco_1502239 [Tanacetum coccineum]
MGDFGNGYSLKDKNKAKTDKTEHGNGKSVKSQSQQVKAKDEYISILFGQPVPELMEVPVRYRTWLAFNCLRTSNFERYVDLYMMSTLVFVDPESSTQADGAQSSRVPAPFPKDPYEAIRQACLVETDTESEPFEDPFDTETSESPHTVASPTPLPDSTPPACHTE